MHLGIGDKITRNGRILRPVISIGICIAMAIPMTGCTLGGKKAASDTVPADAPYYAVKELDFYTPAKDESAYIVSMTPCGDQLAVLIQVSSNGGIIPYTATSESISVSNSDLTAETVAADPVDTTGDTTGDTTATAADSGSTDATDIITSTTETKPIDGSGDYSMKYIVLLYDITGTKTAEIDLSKVLGANDSVTSLSVNADGNFVILVQSFDSVTYAASNKLYTFDSSGKIMGDPLTLHFSDSNFYPYQMTTDASGSMYFGGYGTDSGMIVVLDKQGNTQYEVKNTSLNGNLFNVNGVIYADGYNTEGTDYKYFLYPIDAAKENHLGDPIDVTKVFMSSAPFAGKDGLYVNSGSGIYSYDLNTMEKKSVLLWKDTDIDKGVYSYGTPVILSSDVIFLQGSTYTATTTETKLAMLTRQKENPNVGKKILKVAGINISWDTTMQSEVYKFNTTSKDYRIEVVDYAEDFDYTTMKTAEDYLTAYSEMNKKIYMEILAGNGPDIIYGSGDMSFSMYQSKGLLTDLYTFMDKDTSFKKDAYIPSILKLCETDGHLYKFPTSFTIQGFAGAKSVIGDRTGWTVDEFNAMVNSLPSDVMPIANYTQPALLTASLNASMAAFVDVTTGKVNFDSEEFRQLLDLAKTYGTVDNGDINNGDNYVDEWTLVQNGKLALMSSTITDPTSYDQMATLFGEDVSIVGFPSSTKAGPICSANYSFAISSQSPNQDGAWNFVKDFLSEDSQNKMLDTGWGIPVMTSVFEKQIDRAMNPDVNNGGGPIVYKDMNMGGGSEPMSEASAQAYRDLINSLDTLMDSDQEILSIVMEEVPAYFNGQKTDKAVSALIQNRVQTLVNERQ